jgi:protein involved in polysaccharide export with SLBB domain
VRSQGVAGQYHIGCPDVLEVTVEGRPEYSGRCAVGPDGRVELGPLGGVRVEGRPAEEAARLVAAEARLPAGRVQVRVAEYNSQQVYLFGAVTGLQRAVPYQGPETVLDLLQRVGGITPGAAPGEVHVVRPHVAEGRPPEVFHVDLQAILLKHDQRTNLRVQPFDQIYVGETRQSALAKCVPPCLRPVYEAVCGMAR